MVTLNPRYVPEADEREFAYQEALLGNGNTTQGIAAGHVRTQVDGVAQVVNVRAMVTDLRGMDVLESLTQAQALSFGLLLGAVAHGRIEFGPSAGSEVAALLHARDRLINTSPVMANRFHSAWLLSQDDGSDRVSA